MAGVTVDIVLAAYRAGAAARVCSVNGEVCRRGGGGGGVGVHLIRRILMKQQNPMKTNVLGASVIDLFTSAISNE